MTEEQEVLSPEEIKVALDAMLTVPYKDLPTAYEVIAEAQVAKLEAMGWKSLIQKVVVSSGKRSGKTVESAIQLAKALGYVKWDREKVLKTLRGTATHNCEIIADELYKELTGGNQ